MSEPQGTPHADARRRAMESIAATAPGAFRPDLFGDRRYTYGPGGELLSVEVVTGEAATADTPTTATALPDGPVVPTQGIGQGVRQDPPPAPLTPAEEMHRKSAQLRDLMDRMTGGTGGLII